MSITLIRLDDACPKMDINKWQRIEKLFDKYNVRPLVGIIPDCKDPDMEKYPYEKDFWTNTISRWKKKKWVFALHGFEHVFHTKKGGLNPVNQKSEFAGLSLDQQRIMIKKGLTILKKYDIIPMAFFAPAHTFDYNTLKALKLESRIHIISDTPANDIYYDNGFIFVPQQAGRVRKLPFKTITFCYHPNNMNDNDFKNLENYLRNHHISSFDDFKTNRSLSLFDKIIMKLYFWKHKIK